MTFLLFTVQAMKFGKPVTVVMSALVQLRAILMGISPEQGVIIMTANGDSLRQVCSPCTSKDVFHIRYKLSYRSALSLWCMTKNADESSLSCGQAGLTRAVWVRGPHSCQISRSAQIRRC